MLYKMISPLKEGDEVQYVGVYVLRWNKTEEPEVGFVPASQKEIRKEFEDIFGPLEP